MLTVLSDFQNKESAYLPVNQPIGSPVGVAKSAARSPGDFAEYTHLASSNIKARSDFKL